jgi:DNA-binding NarL/FixJ family response regulator
MILVGNLLFTPEQLLSLYRTRLSLPNSEPLDEKCIRLATLYNLTPRELEIFRLLAHGRSAPYIAEELSIALGTTKNHISNIYRKIGIYDRQSLHNLVEQQQPRD